MRSRKRQRYAFRLEGGREVLVFARSRAGAVEAFLCGGGDAQEITEIEEPGKKGKGFSL